MNRFNRCLFSRCLYFEHADWFEWMRDFITCKENVREEQELSVFVTRPNVNLTYFDKAKSRARESNSRPQHIRKCMILFINRNRRRVRNLSVLYHGQSSFPKRVASASSFALHGFRRGSSPAMDVGERLTAPLRFPARITHAVREHSGSN